jgi:hypothetical protein
MNTRVLRILQFIIVFGAVGVVPHADEGMWTFDDPPTAAVQQK